MSVSFPHVCPLSTSTLGRLESRHLRLSWPQALSCSRLLRAILRSPGSSVHLPVLSKTKTLPIPEPQPLARLSTDCYEFSADLLTACCLLLGTWHSIHQLFGSSGIGGEQPRDLSHQGSSHLKPDGAQSWGQGPGTSICNASQVMYPRPSITGLPQPQDVSISTKPTSQSD